MPFNKIYLKIVTTILCFLLAVQTTFAANMVDDMMRSMGKMYVVVGVIVISFLGLVAFMVYIERRITNMEKQLEEE